MKSEIQKIVRELPHNLEAEQGFIGSIINNNEYINKVNDFLLPEHFFYPVHGKIYNSVIKCLEKGIIASPITLKNQFSVEDELIENMTLFEYLVKLSSNATTIINVESFGKEIYENAIRRNLIAIGEEIVNDSFDDSKEANERIEVAEQKLYNLAVQGEDVKSVSHIKSSITDTLIKLKHTMSSGNKFSGIPTDYIELDGLLGGLQNSDLIILAARPSMGKTSFAINVGLNVAEYFFKGKKDQSVAIFSLEMSSEQLATKMLSIKSRISSNKIRVGNINDNDFKNISKESNNLNKLSIFIDDTPAITISKLRTRARRLKRQNNIGLIIVDYLQLIRATSAKNSRVNEIGEISQGLKAIAKELDVPVIALSQLSRAVESREDKRPLLSDLRESGNIEQDADIVMFIYREEYYLERIRPVDDEEEMKKWQEKYNKVHNIAEIIISKQRNGPIGKANLHFDSDTTSFKNLDVSHHTSKFD